MRQGLRLLPESYQTRPTGHGHHLCWPKWANNWANHLSLPTCCYIFCTDTSLIRRTLYSITPRSTRPEILSASMPTANVCLCVSACVCVCGLLLQHTHTHPCSRHLLLLSDWRSAAHTHVVMMFFVGDTTWFIQVICDSSEGASRFMQMYHLNLSFKTWKGYDSLAEHQQVICIDIHRQKG